MSSSRHFSTILSVTKIFFALFFFFNLFVPQTSFASVCTFERLDGSASCQEISEDSCFHLCNVNKPNGGGKQFLNCYQDPSFATCAEYTDYIKPVGICQCRPGNFQANVETINASNEDACHALEANDPTSYVDCQWSTGEGIDKQFRDGEQDFENIDATAKAENPLLEFKDDIHSLNKLKTNSIQGLIALIIKTAMGVLGTISLIMTIYGGFLWMTSAGNASQTEKAENVLFWGALGVFVIFGSYAIINLIFEAFNPNLTL